MVFHCRPLLAVAVLLLLANVSLTLTFQRTPQTLGFAGRHGLQRRELIFSATAEPNDNSEKFEASGFLDTKPSTGNNTGQVEIVGLSDSMKERLMREATTCSNPYMGGSTGTRRRPKQKFTQVYILAASVLIVLLGGYGILY